MNPDLHDILTPREFELSELVAEAKSTTEICKEMFVTKRAVETHLSNIFKKLKINNRTKLMILMREYYERRRREESDIHSDNQP